MRWNSQSKEKVAFNIKQLMKRAPNEMPQPDVPHLARMMFSAFEAMCVANLSCGNLW